MRRDDNLLSYRYDVLTKMGYLRKEIPECITSNLNPKFKLREYQIEAVARFIHYLNEYQDRTKPTQLLFNMATGSGKTVLMAANILYLYEQGYRNFLFFVNSTNIIEKTRDNFLNPLSPKYLFNENIKFDNKQIHIREVSNFDESNEEDINIIFTTIQGLHSQLNLFKENSVTLEDFKDRKIVLISDEAHHINVWTKKRLSRKEEELKSTWEHTVSSILYSNPENILLEYTATIDLENPAIFEKYRDKLIFEYDLKQFRADGYSKEVKVLQSDLDNWERMLQAVILSQYRRKIAEKYRIQLKPVILFKSKSIKESRENFDLFRSRLDNLSTKDIESIRSRLHGTVLEKVFNYLEDNKIEIDNFIAELKEDFSESKCVLLDSENINREHQINLNNLEDKNNEIRAIFAVKMLDEGWDVLNLFDIVRLYDTRDGRWTKDGRYIPGNTTIAERQLIGRGARYYPFKINAEDDPFKRKFDEQVNHELRILEELYYHSKHNPRYIKELTTTLKDYGIIPREEREVVIKVKDEIKKTDFYTKGVIFINSKVKADRKTIKDIRDLDIKRTFRYRLETGTIKENTIFRDQVTDYSTVETKTERIDLTSFGRSVIRKAMAKLEFYKFNNLKKYFPGLSSSLQFINSLNEIKVDLTGSEKRIKNLTPEDKLRICVYVLKEIEKEIINSYVEYRGSEQFKPVRIKDILKDKKVKIDINESGDQEKGVPMSHPKHPDLALNLREKNWYLFEENYGTFEEKSLIRFIDTVYDKLTQKYSDVYLLRNEKMFKIYSFKDGRTFEPDFVLFLKKENSDKLEQIQIFIEPKGDYLTEKDRWKEDFLLEIEKRYRIKPEPELVMENNDYILIGLPFYSENKKREFEKIFEEKIKIKRG
ncbi:DEAD/DEAH box helicase family protein [Persephonella sp.]